MVEFGLETAQFVGLESANEKNTHLLDLLFSLDTMRTAH